MIAGAADLIFNTMTDEEIMAEDAPETEPSKSRTSSEDDKGVGLRTVLASSAIAAVLGISGGTYFGGMAGQATQPKTIDYSADVETANKSVGTLTAKLERLERQVKDLEKQGPVNAGQLPDMSNVEARLAALEGIETEPVDVSADISALKGRIATLEQAAFEPETLEGLSDIQTRLDALEKGAAAKPTDSQSTEAVNPNWEMSLSELEASLTDRLDNLEQVELPEAKVVDLSPIESRLDQLETRLNSIPVALPPFPREAVLEAIETAKLAKEAGQKKGWLSRTLGDQVVVQDADLVLRLNRIEENVARQDVKAIEQDIASLPEAAQAALGPWLAQIRKTGNTQ